MASLSSPRPLRDRTAGGWLPSRRRSRGRSAGLAGSFVVFALLTAAVGCEHTTISVLGEDDAPMHSQAVHPDWPMTLPPGSVLIDLEVRSDRLRYRVGTDLEFQEVYERLHPELLEDGWQRQDVDPGKRGIEAEYRRERLELEVKVERDGELVKVDLELDD